MSKGYVYALSNEAMPGLIKIGRTCRSVSRRAHELYQTGVPTPFKVEAEVLSPDCVDLERRLHLDLSEKRLSDSREFFRMTGDEARQQVKYHLKEQMYEFVHEFLPDHTLVEEDEFICPSSASYVAHKLGCSLTDVQFVLEFLSEDEVLAAARRVADQWPWRRSKFSALGPIQ